MISNSNQFHLPSYSWFRHAIFEFFCTCCISIHPSILIETDLFSLLVNRLLIELIETNPDAKSKKNGWSLSFIYIYIYFSWHYCIHCHQLCNNETVVLDVTVNDDCQSLLIRMCDYESWFPQWLRRHWFIFWQSISRAHTFYLRFDWIDCAVVDVASLSIWIQPSKWGTKTYFSKA